MARAKQSIPESGAGSVPDDVKRLAQWVDEFGLNRVTVALIAGHLIAWWYDHETGEFHQIPRAYWQNAEQVKQAAGWGWLVGYRFLQDSPDGRSYQIFAAKAQVASQPIKRAQQYRKPVQEEIIRRVRKEYPPDGNVGSRSSEKVRQKISDKEFKPSVDSVHRALRALRSEKLPKK